MDCASCGRANRAGAKFCSACGRPLAARCPACGTGSSPGAQFCDACGASLLAAPSGAGAARKIVTIVFADLIGSTALHERLDAESARRFMERYYAAMRGAVEAHGGRVTQLLGDGVKAVFGAPRVAEDDAIRAVRAAMQMQRAFREIADEQLAAVGRTGLRVAVNTGEVVATDEAEIIGDPVNVAARLQEEARDGGVVIGEATRRLVAELVTLAPLGSFSLKGRAEAVAAYRVVSLERPVGAAAIAFVGREDELARITAVYDRAVVTRAARLAVILGSPGLGKSRLIDEFTRNVGAAATVLIAHCDADGGATFAPLAEALRGLLRIDDGTNGDALRAAVESALPADDPERGRIASGVAALLLGSPASSEEIFFVVRRLLAAFAAARPLVLAIDDIQWAEPLLLDLIEHLVQWGSGVRLLVLAAARPELRDARSSLATSGGLVNDVVTLSGLDAGAAARLAANVIGAEALPAAIAGRVLATSEGNPLFVGELVRMLVHDGALKREGDRWTTSVALAEIEMPPTIHALLAARIERLRPEERTLLERAAVIGRHFSRASVAQLLPREIGDLDARLESLRRSELIESDTGWFLGEPALRFHHVLIRDAAYRRLLKNTRAELHGRFADWLEARSGGAVEHDEMLGWHLEQAHQHLCELGPIDAQGRTLGERAARHLAAAGRRALARDDLPPAASLLGRALDRLDPSDPGRADLALDWCEALLAAGDVGTAVRAIAELGRFSKDSDRLRAWHTCFNCQLAVLTDPQALRASADAVEAAAATLTSAGDAAGEAKAHAVHAQVLAQLGKIGLCETALDKALAAARRAHDRRRANAVLAGAPVAALWGPSPVTRASGRCLDVVRVLRITQGAPAVEAVALRCQAVLETLRGRADAARRMIGSSRRMVEELGITQRVLEADLFAGLIELLEGDAAAAERSLRVAWDGLRAQGLGIAAAQAGALLGRALLAQGRIAEAEAISVESEPLAGDSFKAAIAWRGVRAEALAARGEHAGAIEFARAAVEIAAATDDLLDHADARNVLAVALRAAGRSAEAGAEEKHAIELWEAKGATLLVERARSGVTRSVEPPRSPGPSALPAQTSLRRVRPNAATAVMARSVAAIEARDAEAVAALHSEASEYVDHAGGVSYGREGFLASLRSLSKARDLTFQQEPLAVLGDSLALARRMSSASGVASTTFDVAAYEREALNLFEVDGETLVRRLEIFAPDRLGNAVARLYARYAEILPGGPECSRAAATARSVAVLMGPADPDRWATALAPTVEFTDHRSVGLLGFGRGVETVLRGMRTLLEVADEVANRIDDVIALRSDGFLLRWTNLGTARAGGGAFERQYLQSFVFGSDGLATRMEWFDADRDAEALARFDELTAEPPSSERRVRPNAAIAATERLGAAFAAGDVSAYADLFADDYGSFEHPTGAAVSREGVLSSLHAMLRSSGPSFRYEHLATLGESLALSRRWWSSEATRGRRFDAGASEREVIGAVEVDERARFCWGEMFAPDRLGDAVVRLYQRFAEILPEGPERIRAAATAQSVAAWLQQLSDRFAAVLAPAIRFVDHRPIGMGSARGAEAFLRGHRAQHELAREIVLRIDDVLALRSDALLVRSMTSGIDRASGGAYERPLLLLGAFDSDGRLACVEWFAPDSDTDALARFDEPTAEPPRPLRRVRPNAATAHVAREDAEFAARDGDAILSQFAADVEVLDHPIGAVLGRPELVASLGRWLRVPDLTRRHVPLATLGDALALCRMSMSASGVARGSFDVGTYEVEAVFLVEVDAKGRFRRGEIFADDRMGDALCRLYERYAELLPDARERARAATSARSAAAMLGTPDLDQLAGAFAPDIETLDHRSLGTWSARGAETALQHFRSLLDVAGEIVMREYEVLCIQSAALLVRRTHCGIDRVSGGAYERRFLMLLVFGEGGFIARIEWFDPDDDAEALARFDELTAGPPKSARRVRPNAATANLARGEAAIAARDSGALPALFSDDYEAMDHTTGTSWNRKGVLAGWRSLMNARNPISRHEPLATLGDSLTLYRSRTSASKFAVGDLDIGAFEREQVNVMEVDAQGRRCRWESFAANRLGDAVVRLYERYAELLPDGPGRTRAAATARSFEASVLHAGAVDLERLRTALAPDLVHVDGRTAGLGTTRGAEAFLRGAGALLQLSEGLTLRIDDLLDLRIGAVLMRATTSGTDRASGGPFERSFVLLLAFGSDGRVSRWEQFNADREAEALARFDALTADPPAARIENAATRQVERIGEAWAARDWKRLTELFPAGFRYSDRKRKTQMGELDRDQYFEWMRPLFEMSSSRLVQETLATRGDRLALARLRVEVADHDIGPSEIGSLAITEVDERGERIATVRFDLEDLAAAYAELDARYHAGEAAPHARVSAGMQEFKRAFSERDWDALAARCAPDIVVHDHRLLGWETLHGPAAYVEALRLLVELAPDTKLRIDHSTICENGYLVITVWEGTREGGAYEAPSLMVAELDAAGRIQRFDQYDLERLDEARARYAELRPDPLRIPPNEAARAIERWREHTNARDLEAVAGLLAPSFVFEDRRRLVRDSGDREKMLASVRVAITSGASLLQTLLATAGDRLALVHQSFSISDGARRLSEIEALLIAEVDAQGRVVATVAFDPDDRRGASIEMLDRYYRGEGARSTPRSSIEVVSALNDHDLRRLRAALSDEFYFHDHRRTGVGRLGNADDYVASIAAVLEQSRDMTTDLLYHVAVGEHGSLSVGRMFGTLVDGGEFEAVFVRLNLYQDGRTVGTEIFELEDLDLARARFDALRPDPLRIPPNAATRAMERGKTVAEARDWAALTELHAPNFVYEDRRRFFRDSGDREKMVASFRVVSSSGVRVSETLLATLGDRLALVHLRFCISDGVRLLSDIEALQITEVDAAGRFIANISFDPGDRRAASAELLARDPQRDAVARAMSDHDLPRLRATLPADFTCHDHRRTGLGKLESADEYIASLAALFEQAPDVIIEPLYTVAAEKHANLSSVRMFGTLADGGAFESVMLRLASLRGGEIVGLELFEPEDLGAARARFAELRPDPLRIPANAATRACDRWLECIAAADWDALRALCAPIVFEDRRRLTRTTGAYDMILNNSQVIAKLGGRASRGVLATSGDRLSLERVLWTVNDEGAVSEVETLQITEVDAAGHVVAAIIFDPDDRRAAFDEVQTRFAAAEAAATGGQAPVNALIQAFTRHDWEALRRCLAHDAVVHDHRTLGVMGALSGDDWIESRRVLADLAPDVGEETLRMLAWNRRGRVSVGRLFGTARDGGPFEILFVGVYLTDDDRVQRYEFFDVGDADRAVVRFEELCTEPS